MTHPRFGGTLTEHGDEEGEKACLCILSIIDVATKDDEGAVAYRDRFLAAMRNYFRKEG